MHRGKRDGGTRGVITVRSRERVAIALLDPDSAGYDEMVRQLDELEGSAADRRANQDDEPLLRRVVAFRVGADPDETAAPQPPIPGTARPKAPA